MLSEGLRMCACTFFVLGVVFQTAKVDGDSLCPTRSGSDPTHVNDRLLQLKGKKKYTINDNVNHYRYEIFICKSQSSDTVAVRQYILDPKDPKKVQEVGIGLFAAAQIRGGVDWLMITYPNGKEYQNHCGGGKRRADVFITCDPEATTGTAKLIEEFRTNQTKAEGTGDSFECYYLFELNNKAACTIKSKPMSAGSILLIVLVIVSSVYILLGFLYQRFVVGAKGIEQIPNYNLWRDFGNLQAAVLGSLEVVIEPRWMKNLSKQPKMVSRQEKTQRKQHGSEKDGCNFICRCTEIRRQPKYKPMEDALADDEEDKIDDDNLLPM